MNNIEEISAEEVDTAFHLRKYLGAGLFESVYEVVLAKVLKKIVAFTASHLHVDQKNVRTEI